MDQATFVFHDTLNDFLPRGVRNKPVIRAFGWRASVKDMIESRGVPHCEIELLAGDGVSVGFGYTVRPGDRIDAYPDFEAVPLTEKVRLRAPLEGRPCFLLDIHLGRTAAYLRMLGFDTLWRNDYGDEELARVSHEEGRILLTRDIGLLKRSLVTYGYFVRGTTPRHHMAEIMNRFGLYDSVALFRRCMKCNGLLERVEKDAIRAQLPENAARWFEEFHRCAACGQVYWKGSHFEKMQALIADIFSMREPGKAGYSAPDGS